MKKLIAILLFTLASGASATFLPGPIQISTGTGGLNNIGYALNNSSVPVNVLNTVPVTITQPVVLGATVTFNGTQNVQLQTGANTIGSLSANQSVNVAQIGGNSPAVTGTAGQLRISAEISGTSNTVTANDTLLVSSNTAVPTGVADAGSVRTMADTYGRLVTLPIATRSLVQVATATLTTTTAETILISSTSAKFVRLIGCLGENTSATAADVTIRLNGGPTANNTGSFKLGMSVSNVPVGFFPPGGIPAQLANANTTIQASASVTSLNITCWYLVE